MSPLPSGKRRNDLAHEGHATLSNLFAQLNQELAALSSAVMSSLVQVINRGRGAGAGAIWQSDGIIITNAHVVQDRHGADSQALTVRLHDGRELPAHILAADTQIDLAALQVDARNLPTIQHGDSHALQPGDMVVALGFPFGIQGGTTTGVVIGTGTNLPEIRETRKEWIAASLHLRPGHSGGPMVDGAGRLVGINTLMNGPEVGIAIPVHVVAAFMAQAAPPVPSTPNSMAKPIQV